MVGHHYSIEGNTRREADTTAEPNAQTPTKVTSPPHHKKNGIYANNKTTERCKATAHKNRLHTFCQTAGSEPEPMCVCTRHTVRSPSAQIFFTSSAHSYQMPAPIYTEKKRRQKKKKKNQQRQKTKHNKVASTTCKMRITDDFIRKKNKTLSSCLGKNIPGTV